MSTIKINTKNVIKKTVVGGLVVHQNKILILQRHGKEKIFPGLWELPSGKKKPTENHQVALLREVKEETGLKTKIITSVSAFDYKIKKDGVVYDSTQTNFLVRPMGRVKIKLSDEHQNFAWISKQDIKKYPLSKEVADAIKAGFQILSVL